MSAVEHQHPLRRKRLPAAERRESILAAAAAVFAQAGYHSAKVSDIAARVGVSEPVIFQNFGSKPALFTAVLNRVAEQASASMEDADAHSGSAGRLLVHVISHATSGHAGGGHRTDGRPPGDRESAALASTPAGHHDPEPAPGLFAAAVALAADPAAPDLGVPVLRTLAGHLADIIRHGQQDGSVRADIDPEPAAWLLVSLLAAGPLRRGAQPAGLESAVADLAGRLFSPAHDEQV